MENIKTLSFVQTIKYGKILKLIGATIITMLILGGCNTEKEDSPFEVKRLIGVWKRTAQGSAGPITEYRLYKDPTSGYFKIGIAIKKNKLSIEPYQWIDYQYIKVTYDDGRKIILAEKTGLKWADEITEEIVIEDSGVAKIGMAKWFKVTDSEEIKNMETAMETLQ